MWDFPKNRGASLLSSLDLVGREPVWDFPKNRGASLLSLLDLVGREPVWDFPKNSGASLPSGSVGVASPAFPFSNRTGFAILGQEGASYCC